MSAALFDILELMETHSKNCWSIKWGYRLLILWAYYDEAVDFSLLQYYWMDFLSPFSIAVLNRDMWWWIYYINHSLMLVGYSVINCWIILLNVVWPYNDSYPNVTPLVLISLAFYNCVILVQPNLELSFNEYHMYDFFAMMNDLIIISSVSNFIKWSPSFLVHIFATLLLTSTINLSTSDQHLNVSLRTTLTASVSTATTYNYKSFWQISIVDCITYLPIPVID